MEITSSWWSKFCDTMIITTWGQGGEKHLNFLLSFNGVRGLGKFYTDRYPLCCCMFIYIQIYIDDILISLLIILGDGKCSLIPEATPTTSSLSLIFCAHYIQPTFRTLICLEMYKADFWHKLYHLTGLRS